MIDRESFDYSWHPDETEENYNHVFGCKFHSAEILPVIMYRGHNNPTNNKYNNDLHADLQIEKVQYEDSIFDACIGDKFVTPYIHFVNGESNISYDKLVSERLLNLYLYKFQGLLAIKNLFYTKLSS